MREIDLTKPLSEDDKAWMRQRDRHAEIQANEEQFGDGEPEFAANDDDQQKIDAKKAEIAAVQGTASTKSELPPDDYDKWKVPELAEEAARRDPPVDLTGISKKPDIIAALRTWDAAHPELLAE